MRSATRMAGVATAGSSVPGTRTALAAVARCVGGGAPGAGSSFTSASHRWATFTGLLTTARSGPSDCCEHSKGGASAKSSRQAKHGTRMSSA